MRRNSKSVQSGAEIVEFMITLPVVLLLLSIIFDMSVALSDKAILTQATRSAVREVIRGGSDAEAQAAFDQIAQTMLSHTAGDPLPILSIVRAGTDPGDQVTVSISYTYAFIMLPNFISAMTDITLTSTTIMNMMPT